MSINILFEQKPTNGGSFRRNVPAVKAYGFLCGSEVIVDDPVSMNQLINNGFYGTMLGQRMNFYNTSCFPNPGPPEKDEAGELIRRINHGAEWLIRQNFTNQDRMYLCAEEAVYLMKTDQLEIEGKNVQDLWNFYAHRDGVSFKKRFKAYESLRNQGWTVRTGINFSGDYSLYKGSPKTCHASAVVSIVPNLKALNSETTVAMRRSLKNVKKALLLVIIQPMDGQDWDSVNFDSLVQIETYHTRTPLSARKVEVFNAKS